MRWHERQPGNIRVRTGFLLFPKRIRGEWRWLERAKWREEWFGSYADCWSAVKWLD